MKNILLAIRMLLRFRVYTLINLFGLILSLACALIIARYIHQEYTVDHYCPELDRTFLMTIVKEGDKPRLSRAKDYNKDPNFIDPLNDPSIDRTSAFIVFEDDCITSDDRRYAVRTVVADSSFLDILPHPVVKGQGTIKRNTDAIVTKEMAQKLFGDEDPIGKIITSSSKVLLTIVGVIDQAKTKSSIQFDVIASIDQQKYWSRMEYLLVQLHRKEDIVAFNKKNATPMKLKAYLQIPVFYQLFPLKSFYLDTEVVSHSDPTTIQRGNIQSLRVLSIVALLLLFVGIFNYINLHSVIMLRRARELGIKKVYGAKGRQIFGQLYLENCIVGFVALFFIWLLIEVTQGLVSNWFNIPVQSNWQFDLLASVVLLIILPLITTITPFVRYYYSEAITSLRSINRTGGSIVSRTVFMWIQYVITISLVILAIYFTRQLNYMLNADLNFNHNDILSCKMILANNMSYDHNRDRLSEEKKVAVFEMIKQRVFESPLFRDFAFGVFPTKIIGDYEFIGKDGSSHKLLFKFVDQDYLDLYGFKLKEGRLWNGEDDRLSYNLIVNEAVVNLFGLKDVLTEQLTPIHRLWYSSGMDENDSPPYNIVGVIENFNAGHLSKSNQPIVFLFSKSDSRDDLMVAIAPGKRAEAITFLEDLFHEINGEGEFTYTFLDDEIAALYKEDARAVKIYVTFAIIAILISCLGLFGLSLYDIRQRYREIALRKINGASEKVITLLLFRKYLYTLLFAAIVASGVSYIAIEKYMENYSTRASLSAWIFVVAILITAFISFCTLWWQIRKAIQINPADVLRGE